MVRYRREQSQGSDGMQLATHAAQIITCSCRHTTVALAAISSPATPASNAACEPALLPPSRRALAPPTNGRQDLLALCLLVLLAGLGLEVLGVLLVGLLLAFLLHFNGGGGCCISAVRPDVCREGRASGVAAGNPAPAHSKAQDTGLQAAPPVLRGAQ